MTISIAVVGGVASGLVLTVAVRAWDAHRRRRERAGQIRHLSEVLVRHRTKIYDCREKSEPGVRRLSSPRVEYYDNLCEELRRSLKGRSSRLTFDEIDELEATMLRPWGIAAVEQGVCWYLRTFETAESISWLDLPPPRPDHTIFSEINPPD